MSTSNKNQFNLFEMFSWIGSQHQALKNIGLNVNVVWIADWYIDALITYWINHLNIKPVPIDRKQCENKLLKYNISRDSKEPIKTFTGYTDEQLSITEQVIDMFWEVNIKNIKWKMLVWKDIDLLTYSFPCQDISTQWNQKWFHKCSNTRSSLLWEIERILKEIKDIDQNSLPKYLLMENVKALLSDKFKSELDEWLKALESLWYKSNSPTILNSSNYWSPQRRERVFMLSMINGKPDEFTNKITDNPSTISSIFENNMKHIEFVSSKIKSMITYITRTGWKQTFLDWYSKFNSDSIVYHLDSYAPTITSTGANSKVKIVVWNKIVYLNSFEHLKLQWFNKKFYREMVKIWLSDTKIKYLAGNAISVNVLENIFNQFFNNQISSINSNIYGKLFNNTNQFNKSTLYLTK